jgi:hypothetical protein
MKYGTLRKKITYIPGMTIGNMKIRALLFLLLTAVSTGLFAQYASYGNDYLNLLRGPGGELYGTAYGLMQNGSENTLLNPARLRDLSDKSLYLYHASWFRNEVTASSAAMTFHYKDQPVGLMVSRIGISDVPDSRNALLDYGLDGIPGTGDTGEGNGQLDPNEIIDYDGVLFTGIANYTLHIGMPVYQKNDLSFGLSLGLLYTDLIQTRGYGLTFNVYAEHRGNRLRSLYSVQNLPSALMVFGNGTAQVYPPQIKAAWLLPLKTGNFNFQPGISAAVSFAEDLDYYLFSLGSIAAFDLLPMLQVEYKNLLAAGISYRFGEGFHAGLELRLPVLDITYSFRPSVNADLGSSHLVSLRISTDIFK